MHDARDALRKSALYRIPKDIRDLVIEAGSADVIGFFPDRVWVDSHDFAQRVTRLVQAGPDFEQAEYLEAQALLKLYKSPFLSGFSPKPAKDADNARFLGWKEKREKQLANLRHQLFERLIPFCLRQQENWWEAETYAKEWLASPESSVMPLQYLIWLAANQGQDTLHAYLGQLRAREEQGEVLLGSSTDRWTEVIKRGKAIPLSFLQRDPTPTKAKPAAHSAGTASIDRQGVLDEILMLMTNHSEGRVFAITGLPGVGKTEIARAAVDRLAKEHDHYKAVMVELTAELDLELLCNDLLRQLGRQELLALDYSQKKRRLRQILQMPNLVIIVDEGNTVQLADQNTVDAVLALLQGACVMLVARNLPRFDHYVVEIPKSSASKPFLSSSSASLGCATSKRRSSKKSPTSPAGLPLLLLIITGGLKKN